MEASEFPTAEQWKRWGIDPGWHRSVTFTVDGSRDITWSVLENGTGTRGTIVCVHGNPTWGYLWKDILEQLAPEWRVIAIDQTGMGWSERSDSRTLEQRIAELVAFCQQHTSGPLVLMAHDWGGPVAVGAAPVLELRAVILANTGVALPEGVPMPPLISVARRFVDLSCRRSPLFVAGTARMTAKEHRSALRAPYRTSPRRTAIADFVADIPLRPGDPSWSALTGVARSLEQLDVPLLLVWGGADPVFNDRFLADLVRRAPHAYVHRFPDAGHLVPLDAPMASVAAKWLDDVILASGVDSGARDRGVRLGSGVGSGDGSSGFDDITAALVRRSNDPTAAFTDANGSCSWRELAAGVENTAQHLVAAGLERGDRVALLVPPGVEMLRAAYGVWRAGGVLVVVDRGLGLRAMRRLLRGSGAKWVLGTPTTLAAARAIGLVPGARLLCTTRFPTAVSLVGELGAAPVALRRLEPHDEAAIVHTSGSTGPAKAVRYTHSALAAQRDVVAESFSMSEEFGFVTSFAPFIVLGPGLGVPSVLPEIDVTKPAELDFEKFAAAVRSSRVDVAWLSPASARRIAATAAGRRLPLRLVMLAGAPIPAKLALEMAAITGADVRSPWGMTEAMPLTDGRGATEDLGDGTLTGAPLEGATVLVLAVDRTGTELQAQGHWGELAVTADWMFDGYEQQWAADASTSVVIDGRRFHRTGDLGSIDDEGRLRQLGRVKDALSTADGLVPSLQIESPVSAALQRSVAAVGVGPAGTQAIAVVVESSGPLRLGGPSLTRSVREASTFDIAAVLEGELPVDVRHQSKIKRDVLAVAVANFLAGR